MSKCRSCGAEIKWIKTVAGKNMPCDPERKAYWLIEGARASIVTEMGEVIGAYTDCGEGAGEPDGYGYISHFATCPAADSYRRPRK
jgi:hypothetical protein